MKKWLRFYRLARNTLQLTVQLMRDPEVPFWFKLIPVLIVGYVLVPFDLIPDWVIPGVGYVDDVLLGAWLLHLFFRLIPARIQKKYEMESKKNR